MRTSRLLVCSCSILALTACGGDDSTSNPNDGGGTDASTDGRPLGDGSSPDGGPQMDAGPSVLEHHNHGNRDGVFVDAKLTKAAAAGMHLDTTFVAKMPGSQTYTQPLFVDAGIGGKDVLIVATEQNVVYAFDAAGGATIWQTKALVPPAPLGNLPCGNIDPLGITGTPLIDLASRTIYLDAMTTSGSMNNHHKLFALSLDDGSVKSGWPVDVDTALASAMPDPFDSNVQNQRGAITKLGNTLYVPYGGFYGDCGAYHGWLVGVDVTNPTKVLAWGTPAQGGGAWCAGGVSTDGTSLYITTGNTFGAGNDPNNWQGGDAVVRLAQGPTFSTMAADFFAPGNWPTLDAQDLDMGTHVLVNAPAATPSSLVLAFGKDGFIYVTDRANMGGVGKELSKLQAGGGELTGAVTTFTTASGTYVSFRVDGGSASGCPKGGGNMGTVKIDGSPAKATMVWCSNESDLSLPITSMTDATGKDAIVWNMSSSTGGGSSRLYAYDAESGAEIFAGGGNGDVMKSGVRYFNTPIVAKGKVYVAANAQLYAYTP